MKQTRIKIKKLHLDAEIPKYQSVEAAGFDLHSIDECVLKAGNRAVISTGLAFEIESGFEVQVRPRSGLALKNGISVLNTPGTIDSDYRGEIKVILVNHSQEDFIIHKGDRIAQGVVNEITQAVFAEVEELSESQRENLALALSGVSK